MAVAEFMEGFMEGFSVTNILIFIAIIFAAFVLGQMVSSLMGLWLKDRRPLAKQLSKLINYAIFIIFLYVGLVYILEFNFASFLAAFGIIGIAIAFASQQTISNMIAGIYLSAYGLVKEGDMIDVKGDVCEVRNIGLMNVQAKSLDGKVITIPKSAYLSESVFNALINYSQGGVLRLSVPLNVSTETSLEGVSKLLLEICNRNKDILPEVRSKSKIFEKLLKIPEKTKRYDPEVVVKGLSADYYQIELWVWIYDIKHKDRIISRLLKEVKAEFDKNGIKLKPL